MIKKHNKFLLVLFCLLLAIPFATDFLHINTQLHLQSDGVKNEAPMTEENLPNDVHKGKGDIWTDPTYKTYEDYFTYYDITSEAITNEDYSGAGTKENPYIIHSTKGFLWFFNANLNTLYLSHKYIELGCDIVLNDESFDEDGNPSGGDGVVFSWQSIANNQNIYFNGNGHKITGIYFNDSTASTISLFLYGMQRVENFNCENFFLYADKTVAVVTVSGIANISNICLKNGYVKGNRNVYGVCGETSYAKDITTDIGLFQYKKTEKGGIAGISFYLGKQADNCINYSNITTYYASYSGGLFGNIYNNNVIVSNCKNYGNIIEYSGSETGVGGLIGRAGSIVVKDCKNYGKVLSSNNDYWNAGGIVGSIANTKVDSCTNFGEIERGGGIVAGGDMVYIFNCKNYGNISYGAGIFVSIWYAGTRKAIVQNCINYGSVENGYYSAGIGYSFNCYFEMINCENYGTITNVTVPGEIIGVVGVGNQLSGENVGNIINCKAQSNSGAPLIGTENGRIAKFNIKNCEIIYKDCLVEPSFTIARNVYCETNIENCSIVSYGKSNITLFNYVDAPKLLLKNICLNIYGETNQLDGFISNTIIKSNVIEMPNMIVTTQDLKLYYGSDFSGFYCDWKNGKIGLKSLSSKGFYQATLTEQMLIEKGYQKRTA